MVEALRVFDHVGFFCSLAVMTGDRGHKGGIGLGGFISPSSTRSHGYGSCSVVNRPPTKMGSWDLHGGDVQEPWRWMHGSVKHSDAHDKEVTCTDQVKGRRHRWPKPMPCEPSVYQHRPSWRLV